MQDSSYVVLIVDDSRTTRLMLRQALEEANFVVQEAESGEMAIKQCQASLPDIILLDVQMKGIDGFTTCKELHHLAGNVHVPIVMITGSDDINSINNAYAAGATDFITKPFNWNLIAYRIRYIIRSSQDYIELQHSKEEILFVQKQIQELNMDLEKHVAQRTLELNNANEELKITLATLRSAQNKLIESEKMAFLGGLVSTIANETNTPIDVSNNTAHRLKNKIDFITRLFKKNTLKKSDLSKFLKTSNDAVNRLENNLQNVSEVIKSFNQISVSQIIDTKRTIDLKTYFEEIIFSLKVALKQIQVIIDCPDGLEIETYPGVLFRIFSILIMNSVTHAFQPHENGIIKMTVVKDNENIIIYYADTGAGIQTQHLPQIFNPFFTTKRDQGHIGLGLHVAYNQITQVLGGTIHCESEIGKGTTFIIKLPLTSPDKFSVTHS
jgi:signal transduction histidine kinase